jgi:hypothetical protein
MSPSGGHSRVAYWPRTADPPPILTHYFRISGCRHCGIDGNVKVHFDILDQQCQCASPRINMTRLGDVGPSAELRRLDE